MAILRDNDVYIYVYHAKVLSVNEKEHKAELQPYTLEELKELTITFPQISGRNYNCTKEELDPRDPPGPTLLTPDPKKSNRIGIRFKAGRSQKKYVAIDYMNQGHIDPNLPAPDPGDKHDVAWPDQDISLAESSMRSASMSAKGDHEAPHRLNFYFRVTITTKEGFVLNLLLAQSGSAEGLLKRLYHIGKAAVDGVKAGLEAYEGDEEEALEKVLKFEKDVKTISKENHNPWYVTVLGDKDWPAVAIDKHSFWSTVSKKDVVKNSLVYTGPVGTANPPENIQSARFYYYSEHPPQEHAYYTFNVILYDKKRFEGHFPEEVSNTEILFLEEKGGLYRYNLYEADKREIAQGIPLAFNIARPNIITADDDVCCYLLESYGDAYNPNYTMVVRYGSQGRWQEKKFAGVRADPVLHKGKVYFSRDTSPINDSIIGIFCFDPSNPSEAPRLLVETFRIAQTSVARPTRLTILPGSDYLYYLAAGGKDWKEQGNHLHRYDVRNGRHEVIQRPSPVAGDVGRLDDTQFVFCKDQIYYSEHMRLFRRRADGKGEAQQITFNTEINDENNDVAQGVNGRAIHASPSGDYVFYTGWRNGTIFRVSTSDPSQITAIFRGGRGIQAVSEQLIFLDTTTIDFNGNEFNNLRRRVTASNGDDNDHRELKSSDPVKDVVVLGREVFGTVGKEKGRYQLVRGEIPDLKTITAATRIKFSFIADGYRVLSASSVADS